MALSIQDARALGYLLELIPQDQQVQIRARLELKPPAPGREADLLPPPSIRWWLLACDDPEINALVVAVSDLGDAVGGTSSTDVPFGAGARRPAAAH